MKTFEALRDVFIRESHNKPLVLAIEDLHWIDRTSEEFLDYLIGWIASARILLILLYRPEYTHQWGSKSYYNRIGLDQLGAESSTELVEAMLEGGEIAPELRDVILNRAAGNPLFMEEFTHTLLENGTIRKKDQQFVLTRDLSDVQVPDTIQGIIAARMDRLEDNLKRTMQVASVIGRDFAFRILQAITGMKEEIKSHLMNLQGLEFIYEKRFFPELEYIFKHALIQEVAYNSLLQKRRRDIHEQIGKAIEEIYSDRIEEFYEMLAFHYARTDLADTAIRYLSLAAEKASNACAHEEAVAWLQEAIEHTDRLPKEQQATCCIDLVTRYAQSLFYLGRRQEALDRLRDHEYRLKHLQQTPFASSYYLQLSQNYGFQGEREKAFHYAQRALREAELSDDTVAMGKAYTILSLELFFAGPYDEGVAYGEKAVRLLKNTKEHIWLGLAYYHLGAVSICYGDFGRVKEAATELHNIGEVIGERRYLANANAMLGHISRNMAEWEKGIEHYHRALSHNPDSFEKAIIIGFLGMAHRGKGDLVKAIETLEQAVEQAKTYRSLQIQSRFNTALGEAYAANGQIKRGLELVNEGLKVAQKTKNPLGIGNAQRALGQIAEKDGDFSEAEEHFKEALVIFTAINARNMVAESHLDFASLAQKQRNLSMSSDHLNLAHSWFKRLQVPEYIKHCEKLAREYGIAIAEVDLDG
jgi:predicted ATPase